ncbi:MAG: hypothetical protein FJ096_11000 [Deltaproteobacteria bacterium]|nr:hypothetical protein [Deltaproteobacteria bacterium]
MFELKNPPEPVRLLALRNGEAPRDLPGDVRALLALLEALRQRFWAVLESCLDGDPTEAAQARIFALCDELGVDSARLKEPLRGARFLIVNAARAALPPEGFVEDLERLAPDGKLRHAVGTLLPCYEKALPKLRLAIVARTVADHGKLAEDVSWRVDKIVNSEHGDGVNLPVAVLTSRYREGERSERITLHLLPEQLQKLKDACGKMLPCPRDRSRAGSRPSRPGRSRPSRICPTRRLRNFRSSSPR